MSEKEKSKNHLLSAVPPSRNRRAFGKGAAQEDALSGDDDPVRVVRKGDRKPKPMTVAEALSEREQKMAELEEKFRSEVRSCAAFNATHFCVRYGGHDGEHVWKKIDEH